jgi:hypothetical protein
MRFPFLLLVFITGLLFYPACADIGSGAIRNDPFYPDHTVSRIAHANTQPEWPGNKEFWYSDSVGNHTSWFFMNGSSLSTTRFFDPDRLPSTRTDTNISPDGSSISYAKDYILWLYDTRAGRREN